MTDLSPEILLWLKVRPNAKSSEVLGWENNYLKVRLAAPPVDGKANKALCEYMAKLLAVPKRQVTLVNGDTSRIKRIKIVGVGELPQDLR